MSSTVLRDHVADVLRALIIRGEIPPSSSLREERLATRLNVSRTPLREAVRRLVQEGFLEQEPRRGVRVVAFNAELVREVYQVREALEGVAARETASRIPSGRVDQLRQHIEMLRSRIDGGDFSDTGDVVHDVIVEFCGNTEIQRLMGVWRGRVRWIQQTSFRISQRLGVAFQEHDSIVRALEARDGDWAERATREHIRNTVAELMRLLDSTRRSTGVPAPSTKGGPLVDFAIPGHRR